MYPSPGTTPSPSTPVLVLDAEGTVRHANALARTLFGRCLGRKCWNVVSATTEAAVPLCDARCPRTLLRGDGPQSIRAVLAGHPGRLLCAPVGNVIVSQVFSPNRPGTIELTRHLSPREIDVIEHLAAGASQGRAAQRLGIATETVRSHLKNARQKLAARSTGHLLAKAAKLGLTVPI